MKHLKRRVLATAERLQVRPVCRACLGWGRSTVCDQQGGCLRPETCPTCGRVMRSRVRHLVVGVNLERL